MRKAIASLAATISSSALTLTVNAQTPDQSNPGTTLAGEVIAVVAIAVIFGVIAYAGYKIVKKWSRSD
jgi:hypothetical protein